ncbi:CHASE3 domain-containing protein [Parvibaculum sp.]|uniref:CHASE3 domain-containing protein n=1 Tax=Parvibaculum sp. TaxID=2024848 RepID=UPI002BD2DAB3|nr:CHASE3 domain-containing protein [Parvibaculum sp.]HUD53317.1 CHASE3 domain-containing protein [Parvibaculum sp.]
MTPTNRILLLALVPLLISLGVIGGFSVYYTQAWREKQDFVIHTYRAIRTAEALLTDMLDAETGQRGYLLTGRPAYLAPYQGASKRAAEDFALLTELTEDNPRQQKRTAELQSLMHKRFDLLEQAIRLHDSNREISTFITSGSGKAVMDEIRRIVGEITSEEEALLSVRSQSARDLEQRTTTVTLIGSALAIIFLLGSSALLLRSNVRLTRTEKTLAQKATLLQATLDSIRDGIAAFDAQGRLRAFNTRFFSLLEFPGELAHEGAALANFQDIDRHRNHPILGELPAGGQGEEAYQRIAIDHRELDVYRNALNDGGFLVACLDVTQRVRADAIIRQAQKMEAIGHLTGGIAHDFNNLLQIISANLDLLATDVQGSPRASGRLQNAISGVERGSRLTQQLLAFARRQPLDPRPLNLGRLLQEMTELLRRTLGERYDVEAVIAGGLWNTLIDPVQVENAILNLAINARDAMKDGGKLTIEVSNAVLDDAYAAEHEEVSPGQYVMLAVSDTGEGMPQDVMARVFEPFFTTKPEGRGTGLGLSQVYGFVKQSGGHIKIYSEIGHGTTVKLYLPRARRGQEAIQKPTLAPVEGGTETILVVEDDAGVRAAATDLLKELGYSVLKAENADEALALIDSGARPDLLFTDVVMPGDMNTRDFARRAQILCPNLLVLFTSGYTQNAIVHNGRLDDDVFLLSKPYRREELARKVRGILDTAKREVEAPAPAAPIVLPPSTPQQPTDGRKFRILVVEDEFLVRMSTVDMLESLGHEVKEADSGASALDALRADREFDVVVTDLGLGDMAGAELVALMRKEYPSLRIVIASGYDSTGANAEIDGEAVFLSKPFQLADIRAALEAAMGV